MTTEKEAGGEIVGGLAGLLSRPFVGAARSGMLRQNIVNAVTNNFNNPLERLLHRAGVGRLVETGARAAAYPVPEWVPIAGRFREKSWQIPKGVPLIGGHGTTPFLGTPEARAAWAKDKADAIIKTIAQHPDAAIFSGVTTAIAPIPGITEAYLGAKGIATKALERFAPSPAPLQLPDAPGPPTSKIAQAYKAGHRAAFEKFALDFWYKTRVNDATEWLPSFYPPSKLASISLSPRQCFTYVPLPEDLATGWTEVQKEITPPDGITQEIDHITLVFCGKLETDIPDTEVDAIVKALGDAADDFAPLHAKVQGWAYFDEVKKDGKDMTAVVALVDAPGIEDLLVALKSALKAQGLKPSEDHAFVPHITFCYIPRGHRINDMPRLGGEFKIDRICFANKDVHSISLSGSIGKSAALAVGPQQNE